MPSAKNKTKEMSFWEHLDDLRGVLIRVILTVIGFTIVAFFFKDFIYTKVILGPREPDFFTNKLMCKLGVLLNSNLLCINQTSFNIINIEMAGQFRSHLLISFIAGLVISVPFILWQIWSFIKSGLYKNEKKGMHGFVFYSSILFIIGVLFGYYLIDPLVINFLVNYSISPDVVNQIRLGSYISNVLMVCLSTGIIFQLPLLIYFLTKIGIVTPLLLKKYRKHVAVLFFILSAIITPPDVFSQFLVVIPLFGLYEISIYISKCIYKKQQKSIAG